MERKHTIHKLIKHFTSLKKRTAKRGEEEMSSFRRPRFLVGTALLVLVLAAGAFGILRKYKFSADSTGAEPDFILAPWMYAHGGPSFIGKSEYRKSPFNMDTQFKPLLTEFDFGPMWDIELSAVSANSPSVVVDSKGNFFATAWSDYINKYDSSGKFVAQYSLGVDNFDLMGDGNVQGNLMIDQDDKVYVGIRSSYAAGAIPTMGVFFDSKCRVEQLDNNLKYIKDIQSASKCTFGDSVTNSYITNFDSGSNSVTGYGFNKSADAISVKVSGAKLSVAPASFGKKGTAEGDFTNPTSIAVDAQKNVYIFDSGVIKKYNSAGQYALKWGSAGSGDGQFGSADVKLAFDPAGFIYAADSSRIQKFDLTGKFLSSFGLNIVSKGLSARNGTFVVWDNAVIEKIDESGKVLAKLDGREFAYADGAISHWPTMYVDSSNFINVMDTDLFGEGGHARLERFDTKGNFVSRTVFESQITNPISLKNGSFFDFQPGYGAKISFMIFDQSGKVAKSNEPDIFSDVPHSTSDYIQTGLPVLDQSGNLYATANVPTETGRDQYVIKLNSQGDFLKKWKIFSIPSSDYYSFGCLGPVLDESENLVVVCPNGSGGKFTTYGPDGNIIKQADNKVPVGQDFQDRLIKNKNGDLIIYQEVSPSRGNTYKEVFYRFDKTFKSIDQWSFDVAGGNFQPILVSGLSKYSSDSTPPTAPANLKQTAKTTTGISISWEAASDNVGVEGYKVRRNGTEVNTTNNLTYSDSNLATSTEYTYQVVAYDRAGNQSASSEIKISTDTPPVPQAPSVPANLGSANITLSAVSLTWTAPSGGAPVSGYKVFRDGKEITTGQALSFNDSGLKAGTKYAYTVAAYNEAGLSAKTASLEITTLSKPPTADVPTEPFSIGWNMVSFPESSPNADRSFVPSTYKFKEFNVSANKYLDPATLVPGKGYWVKIDDVNQLKGKSYSSITANSVINNVTKGWNLLGNPFITNLPITNLSFNMKDGSTKSFTQAASDKDIAGYSWSYESKESPKSYHFVAPDPSKYNTSAKKQGFIAPYRGFWLYVKSDNVVSAIIKSN